MRGLTAKQIAAALASGQSAFAVKSHLPTMLLTVRVVRVEDGMAIITGRAGESRRRPSELVTMATATEAWQAEQARLAKIDEMIEEQWQAELREEDAELMRDADRDLGQIIGEEVEP